MFAFKIVDEGLDGQIDWNNEELLKDLVLLSIFSFDDQLRESSLETIKILKEYHIECKMITGDTLQTAEIVGQQLNLLENNLSNQEDSA